jgi:drug/metabolite transporter (DMT)-like permease
MHVTNKNQIKGYLYAMLAAILWGSSGTVGKALFKGGMTPFELVQIRLTLSTVLLALVFGILSRELLKIRFKDIGYFLLLGGLAMAMVQSTYLYAISKIQVAAATLLQYLSPLLVTIFSVCYWKEGLTVPKLISLVLSFSGCYLVVGGYNLQLLQINLLGILGGLGAALSAAGYTLLGERGMYRYKPCTVLFYAMAFACLTWHIIYPPFHYISAGFSALQWVWLMYIAVMGTIIPFGLYFTGINYIRSTRAIITATLEPISAGLLAFLFLGETLEYPQILGGAVVVGAIVLLQTQREQDEMAPELIRARRNQDPLPKNELI